MIGGDANKRVSPGDRIRISAETYNGFLDAARAARSGKFATGAGSFTVDQNGGIRAKVKNTTGSAKGRFSILALSAPFIDPDDDEPEFKRVVNFTGTAPGSSTKPGRFCVLQEPLANNAIGWAMVAGVTPVQLSVSSTLWDFAELESGVTATLKSQPAGSAQVLWAETSGSTRWAYVRLGGPGSGGGVVKGKLDDTLAPGDSAVLSIWRYNGSVEADTGENVTVHPWHLASGQSVATGKEVSAYYEAATGRWYVLGAECP